MPMSRQHAIWVLRTGSLSKPDDATAGYHRQSRGARRIVQVLPDTEVIMLTTHADDESVVAALEAGARG
jgi:DNA-binding NarL/FixJ family response regulator